MPVTRAPVFVAGDGVEMFHDDLLTSGKSVASAHEQRLWRIRLGIRETGLSDHEFASSNPE